MIAKTLVSRHHDGTISLVRYGIHLTQAEAQQLTLDLLRMLDDEPLPPWCEKKVAGSTA